MALHLETATNRTQHLRIHQLQPHPTMALHLEIVTNRATRPHIHHLLPTHQLLHQLHPAIMDPLLETAMAQASHLRIQLLRLIHQLLPHR